MRLDDKTIVKMKRLRKLLPYLLIFPMVLPLTLPFVILTRLLRPFILIRFGQLFSSRIGHFVANTERYLCERDEGKYGPRVLDLFYCHIDICNEQLKRMWTRQLPISPFYRWLHWTNQLIPGRERHSVTLPSDQNLHECQVHHAPHLHFTEEEATIGKKYLQRIGMKPGDRFICFFSRDSRYLDEACAYRSREKWAYHDFRNAHIDTHVPAAETLADSRGYYAFRMGHLVEKEIHSDNPKIIDYASNGDRTELLDLYLCANCYLFLQSGGSGIASVARVFQRPIVAVNQIPLQWCHGNPVTVFIPKKLWLKEERRFLTFREILESGAGLYMKTEDYERAGIECVENTAEEITAAAKEADERLQGKWRPREEDETLQKRFQALFPEHRLCGKTRSPIGAEFLRQNTELLP